MKICDGALTLLREKHEAVKQEHLRSLVLWHILHVKFGIEFVHWRVPACIFVLGLLCIIFHKEDKNKITHKTQKMYMNQWMNVA